MKFMGTLTKVLDLLTNRVKHLAEEDIMDANISQIWGILLLLFVMILSPILVILAKNAITSIQVGCNVEEHINHAGFSEWPLSSFLKRAAAKRLAFCARNIQVMCQDVWGFALQKVAKACILSEEEDRPRQNMLKLLRVFV